MKRNTKIRYSRRDVRPCIYKIVNLMTGDLYVGSTWKEMERFYWHWRHLRSSNHPNIILQRAVDKYGLHNFQFETIRAFLEDDLNRATLYRLEQQYIDSLNPKYNISHVVDKPFISEAGKARIADHFSYDWIVIDPSGNRHKVRNLKQFCRDRGLHQSGMWGVSVGRQAHCRGWKCYRLGKEISFVNKTLGRFIVIKPDGSREDIVNLTEYCKNNGLNYRSMLRTIGSSTHSHLGYSCERHAS